MNENRTEERGGAVFIFSIPVAIASLLFLIAWDSYSVIRDSDSWPSVKGSIAKSEVARSEKGSYYPDIVYRYEVNGRTYYDDWLRSTADMYGYREPVQKVVDQLPVGREVEVFYSPSRPDVSYLEPPTPRPEFLVLIGAIWLFWVGVLVRVVVQGTGWLSKHSLIKRGAPTAEEAD